MTHRNIACSTRKRGGPVYPPVTYTDRYVQYRDPNRAVKPPPLELPHRQDGDYMRRLAVLTANHRCLLAAVKKAAVSHGHFCWFRLSSRPIVYKISRLPEQGQKWSASGLCMTVSVWEEWLGRIVAWSDCVLAAEAKKAGRASEATRLTPRLASVIVGEA